MKKEVLITAKTIEQAVENGAIELGARKEDVTYEVIEMPKKGILGFRAADAKVRVLCDMSPKDTAIEFLSKIIAHMNINAKPTVVEESKTELKIDIVGENLGILIGYHGEILDSLQYLTYLAVNKGDEGSETESDGNAKSEAVRVSIDVENYRKKREETLKELAKKMADKALKYRRPVTLEPMSAYERRIIHSTIQDIEGVTTYSVGQDNERKIVITKENYSGGGAGGRSSRPYYRDGNAPRKERPKEFKPFSSTNAGRQQKNAADPIKP